jgi:hypothetical protein
VVQGYLRADAPIAVQFCVISSRRVKTGQEKQKRRPDEACSALPIRGKVREPIERAAHFEFARMWGHAETRIPATESMY